MFEQKVQVRAHAVVYGSLLLPEVKMCKLIDLTLKSTRGRKADDVQDG
jgi:hypothetical protein